MGLDSRISLYKLEVLCAVVEWKGVSRAASQLFVSQPVVTAHIRSLEERLGVELFERAGRGMVPTEVGSTVYRWAKDVLSRSHEMVREIENLREGSEGSAVIAAGMSAGTYLLPKLLISFYREHPNARITLTQQGPEGALEAVLAGDADFAIVVGTEHEFDPSNLVSSRLLDERLILVTAPDSDDPDAIEPEDLPTLRSVCSPADALRRSIVDAKLREIGVSGREVVLEFDHPEAIKQAVIAGIGAALLFGSSVESELQDGSLRAIEIAGADLTIPLYLVHRLGKHFAPLQQQLLDYVQIEAQKQALVSVGAV